MKTKTVVELELFEAYYNSSGNATFMYKKVGNFAYLVTEVGTFYKVQLDSVYSKEKSLPLAVEINAQDIYDLLKICGRKHDLPFMKAMDRLKECMAQTKELKLNLLLIS